MNEFLKYYIEWKKIDKKCINCVMLFILNFIKYKWIYYDIKYFSRDESGEGEGSDYKGYEEIFFYYFVVVMIF